MILYHDNFITVETIPAGTSVHGNNGVYTLVNESGMITTPYQCFFPSVSICRYIAKKLQIGDFTILKCI